MLPVIFIIVGAGGIYFTWKKKTPEVKTGAAAVEKVNPKNQRVFLALFFFGIFFRRFRFWLGDGRPAVDENKRVRKMAAKILYYSIQPDKGIARR